MPGRLKLFTAAVAILFLPPSSLSQAVSPSTTSSIRFDAIKTIFSFGDSYSTIGYDPNESVTDLPLLGGTTSGGLNWVQYLALSNVNTQHSYFDFAQRRATVNNSIVGAHVPDDEKPWSFEDQTAVFQSHFVDPVEVMWESASALFTVFIGINDIGYVSLQHLNATDLYPRVVASWERSVSALYASGARNFLVLTSPPVDRTPYIRSFGADMITAFKMNVELYTALIDGVLSTLPTKYPDAKFVRYDTQPLFNAILDRPASYGFTVADKSSPAYWPAKVADPNADSQLADAPLREYVWMDDYHPTFSVHKLIANGVATLLSSSVSSSSSSLADFIAISAASSSSSSSSSSASSASAADTRTRRRAYRRRPANHHVLPAEGARWRSRVSSGQDEGTRRRWMGL